VAHVYDFACKFDQLVWIKPIHNPRAFCDPEGLTLHIIVMEYINNALDIFLESASYSDIILKSIVQQLGFILLDIHINHGISHNDLNRGNILLNVGNPETLTYTFGDIVRSVNTEGHLVVLIDFQRSSLADIDDEFEYRVVQAGDEISLAYELLKKWIPSGNLERRAKLHALMQEIMSASSVQEMVDRIDSF
jgi:serine/threonine protein kinase